MCIRQQGFFLGFTCQESEIHHWWMSFFFILSPNYRGVFIIIHFDTFQLISNLSPKYHYPKSPESEIYWIVEIQLVLAFYFQQDVATCGGLYSWIQSDWSGHHCVTIMVTIMVRKMRGSLVVHVRLVGGDWNMFHFFTYWECHHPNWLYNILQRGRAQPPISNRLRYIDDNYIDDNRWWLVMTRW